MNDAFALSAEAVNDTCVVFALEGRLDAISAQQAKEALQQAINEGRNRLVVDMQRVSFVDSAGLAALVSALKSSRRSGGNVVLAGIQPQVYTVFSLTMLDRVFGIYPDPQTALDQLTPALD